MARIYWKPDQWQLVAERSYSLLRDPMFHGSEIEAVRQAQKSLATQFHRPLISMQEVCGGKYNIRDLWKTLEGKGYRSDLPVINPHVNHDIETEHRKTTVLGDISTVDLIQEFMRRLTEQFDPKTIRAMVREEINATLDRRMPGVLPPDPVEPEVEKVPESKKFRVLILGLKEDQQQIMKKRYGKVIDFHFLEGSEGASRIKNTAGLMDFSLKTNWCKGHLGSTSGWPNFTATTGGMTTIQRLLNHRFKLEAQHG